MRCDRKVFGSPDITPRPSRERAWERVGDRGLHPHPARQRRASLSLKEGEAWRGVRGRSEESGHTTCPAMSCRTIAITRALRDTAAHSVAQRAPGSERMKAAAEEYGMAGIIIRRQAPDCGRHGWLSLTADGTNLETRRAL